MEKILLTENRQVSADFQRSVDNTLLRVNELINSFHAFQNWKQVRTYKDFIDLIDDPEGYFDEVLLSNVDLKSTGNLRPNPQIVADLYSIDRESWQNLVAGKPVKSNCEPCKKTTIRKGTQALRLDEFERYSDFLNFNEAAGRFYLNEPAIQAKKESFKIFAETEIQKAAYNHWQDLIRILGEHKRGGYLGNAGMQKIAELCGLRYVPDLGEIFLDETKMLNELLKLQ